MCLSFVLCAVFYNKYIFIFTFLDILTFKKKKKNKVMQLLNSIFWFLILVGVFRGTG